MWDCLSSVWSLSRTAADTGATRCTEGTEVVVTVVGCVEDGRVATLTEERPPSPCSILLYADVIKGPVVVDVKVDGNVVMRFGS